MSIALQTEVWRLALPANLMLVALALADHGKDDGSHIYPSVDQIAWKTGYTERQVQRILRQLEKSGLLIPMRSGGGRNRPTVYRMNTSAIDEKAPRLNGDNMSPIVGNGDILSPIAGETVTSLHPNAERVTFEAERVTFEAERVTSASNRSIGNHHITIREPRDTRAMANDDAPDPDTDPPPCAAPPPPTGHAGHPRWLAWWWPQLRDGLGT